METTSSNKILLMGLIGFVAGILLAPDKGTVTREKLKDKADKFADEATRKTDHAKRKINEMRHKKDAVMNEVDESVETAHAEMAM